MVVLDEVQIIGWLLGVSYLRSISKHKKLHENYNKEYPIILQIKGKTNKIELWKALYESYRAAMLIISYSTGFYSK